MNFTTSIFIFVFFPIAIAIYLLVEYLERRKIFSAFFTRFRINDVCLIVLSMLFYMWACFDDIIKLALYIIVVWLSGCWIGRNRRLYIRIFQASKDGDQSGGDASRADEEGGQSGRDGKEKVYRRISVAVFILAGSILILLCCLIHFKYMPLLADVWNYLFRGNLVRESILAPIGISFITFSAISYLMDIYREDAPPGTLLDCMLYLSFFPKVISGPIVLWKDFKPMLEGRIVTSEGFVDGLNRVMIGFAKKLILADQFGACAAKVIAVETDVITGWGIAFLYMLQIYYDFSGYSDIAIGLARLLGFEFRENFNFPYRSASISEFWRRWHISLGRWFREYVYFPLGGSRAGKRKALRNVAAVFILTGVWHGAGWNYILWGGINGAMVMLEKVIKDKKFYQKQPTVLKWFVTMGITFFCWQFFRFPRLEETWEWLKLMFGVLEVETVYYSWKYYFDAQMITLTAIGAVGAVLFGSERAKALYQRCVSSKMGFFVQEVFLLISFATAILFMINSTYSPFIYFQY